MRSSQLCRAMSNNTETLKTQFLQFDVFRKYLPTLSLNFTVVVGNLKVSFTRNIPAV